MLVFFASPFLLCPLRFPKRNKLIKLSNFFLTFSDALLCLIREYKIEKTDIILLPNFYCPSTLKIIGQYFQIRFYKINNDFSVDKGDYFSRIREFKPRAILNYSYLGFKLTLDERELLKELCGENTLIIDDCAHRILNESEVSFINKNHFYINSLRKHSAFLGAQLIHPAFRPSSKNFDILNGYKIKLTLTQCLEELLNLFTALFSSKWLYTLSEKVFLYSDSIAGTSKRSTKGNWFDYFFYNFLSFEKIRAHIRALIPYYNEGFVSLGNAFLKPLSPEVLPEAEPNYYPLMVGQQYQERLIACLKKNKIFADRLWESHELEDKIKPEMNLYLYDSLIVFPLTWLIRKNHIDRIISIIKNNFKTTL